MPIYSSPGPQVQVCDSLCAVTHTHIGLYCVLLPNLPHLRQQAMEPIYNKEDANSSSSSAGIADLSFTLVKWGDLSDGELGA